MKDGVTHLWPREAVIEVVLELVVLREAQQIAVLRPQKGC
jgi:hypothetical protein